VRRGENGKPTDQQAQASWWTEVVGKKSKNNVPVKAAYNPPAAKPKTGEGKRCGVRTRPAAIVVDVKNQEDSGPGKKD